MSELGHVIALLHGARERYSTLTLDVRVNVDVDHLPGMDRANSSYGIASSDVTIWITSPSRWCVRSRSQDGTFESGRDGETAWTTERNRAFLLGIGARTSVDSPISELQPFEQLWDPALLVSELWLEPLGVVEILGRPGRVVSGEPRPAPRPDGRDFLLLDWPGGDHHELVIDEELGVVLRLRSFFLGHEVVREEVVSILVDEPIDDAVFRGDLDP